MSEKFIAPAKVTMRRSTSIEAPAVRVLPATLTMRRARIEESKELAGLLGGAYPAEDWEPVATENELFHDKTVVAPMVIVSGKQILATASLQIRSSAQNYGWLRWVATKPDRQRQGLAQSLVIRLLTIAADAQCREVRLNTTTDLSGAITLYLRLGFEPLVTDKEERGIWDSVLAQLNFSTR